MRAKVTVDVPNYVAVFQAKVPEKLSRNVGLKSCFNLTNHARLEAPHKTRADADLEFWHRPCNSKNSPVVLLSSRMRGGIRETQPRSFDRSNKPTVVRRSNMDGFAGKQA